MDTNLFLSFIVPVYNAEAHLEECLNSLCRQDIRNYEIICVNDGSTDGSAGILTAFSAEHPNIVVIDKENGGVTTARNAGLDAARGEFIWFVDADDFVGENILGQLQMLAAGTACDKLILDGYEFTDALSPGEIELAHQGKLPNNVPWHDAVVWRSLLRRSFLQEHGLFFRYPDITHGEDGLFMYEVELAHPVCAEVREVMYFYRVHSGSVSTVVTSKNRSCKLHSYIRVTQILRQHCEAGDQSSYTANKLMTFLWFALYETARAPAKDAGSMLRQIREAELFPFRRPPQCSLARSYMTSRTDWIGRAFDFVYLHLHTRPGFAAMWTIHWLSRTLRRIRK